MKTKSIYNLVVLTLTFCSLSAYAHHPLEDIIPSHCSKWSKDPKCWEKDPKPSWPLPALTCEGEQSFCEVIESIDENSYGSFECKAISGRFFDCNQLVKDHGTNLKGVIAKVTVHFTDPCHIPGGCKIGCRPTYPTASLDNSCQ